MITSSNIVQKLISISSPSGEENEIIRFIAQYLGKLGVEAQLIGDNLIGQIVGIDRTKAVILNAHVDTVQPGESKLWEYEPLIGQQIDDKVYGLGASDEKAGVAGLMLLAKHFSQKKPPCDIWMHFVVKEEVDGSGTKEVMEWFEKKMRKKYKAVAGILVEPTGLEKIEIAHKGNWFVKLEVKGEGGHGSRPELNKTNSVLRMGKVLEKLVKLNNKWKKKYHDQILGSPTIGVGTAIMAGSMDCPNKFADSCVASLDVRTVPLMHEKVLIIIQDELQGERVEVECLYEPAGYGLTEISDPLVLTLQKVLVGLEVGVSVGSTDQCFFTKYQIPAIIFGPGESSCIHQANEFCYPKKIDEFVEIMEKTILIWGKLGK